MADSIFTKIIKGEIPSHKVYEDEVVLAFLDIHPVSPGHTLIVPKQPVDVFWELDEATYAHIHKVAQALAKHLHEQIGCQRVGSVVYGLDVPHAHLHLIPLVTGQEIKFNHDPTAEPDHAALAKTASQLALPDNSLA